MSNRSVRILAAAFAMFWLAGPYFSTLAVTPPGIPRSAPLSIARQVTSRQNNQLAFAPDRLIVQFAPSVELRSTPSGGLQADDTALDAILSQLQVQEARPLFPGLQVHGQAAARGLDRIYLLELAEDADVLAAVAALSASPDVAWAEPDYLAYPADTIPNDPLFPQQWGLSKIAAPASWDVVTGNPSVVIAIVDSGLDFAHPDLMAKVWMNPGEIPGNNLDDDNNGLVDDVYGWNFVNETNDPGDDNGHGTQVAGVAAASTDNGTGVAGVCWGCRLMAVKVMQGGVANYSDIAQGIVYAAQKGAKVINLSLGGYSDSQAVRAAVQTAVEDYGALVVAGAGNDNSSRPFYPAAYPEVVAVAGTDSADAKWSDSNYGSWVDVSAPAVNILTTYMGGDYGPANGTSFSTAFASGLAGLLRSQHPDWTPALVQAQLRHTADPIDALNPGYEGLLGRGRINAARAVTEEPHPLFAVVASEVNGDPLGRPVPGERATLQITLGNDWLDAVGVTGLLTTMDPYVTILTTTAGFGDIPAGGTSKNGQAYVFDVAAGAGYNHPIPFGLELTANGGAFATTLVLTITTRGADELVGGTILTNTVWTNDKTYIVQSSVGVMPGVTLTIEAGTVVMFNNGTSLNVGGTLIADGTETQPIRFLPHETGGSWGRVYFDDTSIDATATVSGTYVAGNILRWVRIEGATQGIGCNNATPFLAHVTTDGGGVSCTVGDTPFWLTNSELTGDAAILPSFKAAPSPTSGVRIQVSTQPNHEHWVRTYGGHGHDRALSVQPSGDSGYIAAGYTLSFGAGSYDAWVLKLDEAGNVVWQKTYGGSGLDVGSSTSSTGDGGYVVAGYTDSFGTSSYDTWVIKLDAAGNVVWQKTYGGSGGDHGWVVSATEDGGYVVAGSTDSFGVGSFDAWVLRLDETGNVVWQKTYGGNGDDAIYFLSTTGDGGYVMAGRTDSFGAGDGDVWVLKLDPGGDVIWQKTYGGSSSDGAFSIQPTGDSGYIVAGYTRSFGAGGYDAWVLKLDEAGNLVWQKSYGGNNSDEILSVSSTGDGGYVAAGFTDSFGAGSSDVWVLKLDTSGNVIWQRTYGGSNIDGAISIQTTSAGGYIVAGASGLPENEDLWVMRLDNQGDVVSCSSCSVIGSSSATVTETYANIAASTATTVVTSITPAASIATGLDSLAIPTVLCVSDSPPAAVGDHYTLSEDTSLTVPAPGLLGNDADPDGDPLTAAGVSGPVQGRLNLEANGAFTYTPYPDFSGMDSFIYAVDDGYGCSDTEVVTLTVTQAPPIYHVRGTTVRGSLSLPNEAEVLTCTIVGILTMGNEAMVRGTSATGGITINGSGTIIGAIAGGTVSMGSGTIQGTAVTNGDISVGTGTVLSNTVESGGIIVGHGSSVQGNNVEGGSSWGISAGGAATITRNRVVGNANGIQVSGGLVQANLIANSTGTGLQIQGNTLVISNTLTANTGSAIRIVAATAVPITGNNLEFNTGSYDIENLVPRSVMPTIFAQNNWWGTTDPTAINRRIYDFFDDYNLGQVLYTPVATGPVQTAPAYVRRVTVDPNPVGIETATFEMLFSRGMDTSIAPEVDFQVTGWAVRSPMPTERFGLAAAATPDGRIYAIGGANETSGVLATVEEYRLASDSWTAVTPMPTPRFWLAAVRASNGRIYAIGGHTAGGDVLPTVEEYDPATDSWTTRAPMPTPRYALAAVAAPNGKIYALGGCRFPASFPLATVEEYDPTTDSWITRAPMPTPREYLAAVVGSNGKIYAIGGHIPSGTSFATVEEYDPATDSWTTRAPMPTPRHALAAVTFNDRIYAIGGLTNGAYSLATVEEYDPTTNTWAAFTPMPTPRGVLAAVRASNNRIYVIGGWGGSGMLGLALVEEFTPLLPTSEFYGGIWLSPERYRAMYDFSTLVPRGVYTPTVARAMGADGLEIAPNSAFTFTVDYAGEIGDTSPPPPPTVFACGANASDTLFAQWSANDPESDITLYRYAIGTTPGGRDVINWTTIADTRFLRSGLSLLTGQTYYVAVQAQNAGGLWSAPGVSNGVVAGSSICFGFYLPLVLRASDGL